MFILVCYDIGDLANGGAERLKTVAQHCLNFGVRVQYSVFECRLAAHPWVVLRRRLIESINETKDSLRFYILCEKDERKVEVHGLKKSVDPTGALVFD